MGGGSLYGVGDVVLHTHDMPRLRNSGDAGQLPRTSSLVTSVAGLAPRVPSHHLGSSDDLDGVPSAHQVHPTSSESQALPLPTLGMSAATFRSTTTTTTNSASQILGPLSTASTPRYGGHSSGSAGEFFSAGSSSGDRTKSLQSSTAAVDIVYMKNVLLKFLEAHATSKIAERDALLPAVAALLQASPAEFQAFKKVLANTNPATTQLWSVLGMGGR